MTPLSDDEITAALHRALAALEKRTGCQVLICATWGEEFKVVTSLDVYEALTLVEDMHDAHEQAVQDLNELN